MSSGSPGTDRYLHSQIQTRPGRRITALRQRQDQRGLSMSLEAVIIVPVLVLLISLVIVWSRYALAQTAVEASAGAAARAATLARSAPAAHQQAAVVAQANLASAGVRCAETTVRADVSQFSRASGTPGQVEVVVGCRLITADLGLPVGTVLVESTAHSSLDRYRGRD